jgi:hypothetical protein
MMDLAKAGLEQWLDKMAATLAQASASAAPVKADQPEPPNALEMANCPRRITVRRTRFRR